MLSIMLDTSERGMIFRIWSSIRSHNAAESSMRVPVGARKCKMNCPLSTVGKKSCPTKGSSAKESTQKHKKQTANTFPWRMHALEQPMIRIAKAVESFFESRLHAHQRIARPFGLFDALFLRLLYEQSIAPWWAPASAKADKTPASQIPRLRRGARTGNARRPKGRTWARKRCKSQAWKPAPAPRFARRHPESTG